MQKLLLPIVSISLAACGGTAKLGGGKEGAAQAFFAASNATAAGANRMSQGLDLAPSISFRCPEGGEAALTGFGASIDASGAGASVAQSFTVTYKDCGAAKSAAGVAVYTGSFTVTQSVNSSASGASVDQRFKGRVNVLGAFNDFIEADVRQQVSVTGLSSSSGAVSMKLVGSLRTFTDSHTYNEDINVVAGGSLTVAANDR
ncbi:MAG: hypothetical protein INH41_16565 [Myxococcaceae bacterium]|jgi:hypothetical protein|nr:hypothetical protein [Myxococcaceae bacterium]MCA3013995.1 hypothetical protein [Myxococcaceae bacterium]